MTSKRLLSNKKTSQQTISISPALKDWIKRYVNVNRNENPNDERFKSVSAFYNRVMEKVMENFEKGKTLDDFERFVDEKISNFYDEFSFNAIIPVHEIIVKTNRYTLFPYDKIPRFLFTLRNFYKGKYEENNIKQLNNLLKRMEAYFNSNKIAKNVKFEVYQSKNSKFPSFIIEYVGNYKNLDFESNKLTAAVLGILGLKIKDFIHSKNELYFKFDVDATELFYEKKLLKKERFKLIEYNLSYLINYYNIINDKDYYLWMKMADDKDLIINFNDENVKKKWLNLIESEIRKHGDKDDLLLNILKFFEKLHWIEIENEKLLKFEVLFFDEKEYLLSFLSKYSRITQSEGHYYLKANSN